MNRLGDIIATRIKAQGPLSVADYMSDCLLHPEHGYYSRRDPFGQDGDFITSPEISQMFGELLGLWLAQTWMDQGQPSSFVLAELGPGRGTLMADIWRATRGVPGFQAAARIFLVEASAHLTAVQQETLREVPVTWVVSAELLPRLPLYLVANEFFDALPIRQFQRADRDWAEVRIGWQNDRLCFGLAPPCAVAMLDHRLEDTHAGDLVEICPAMNAILAAINDRIATQGGAALIIDYGDWRSLGDTLQAIKAQTPGDPLADPGQADLTAHVDFEALALAAPHLRHSRLTPQGVFLKRLGIDQRAKVLAATLTGEALNSHLAAHRRLTAADEMGTLFKVMALYAAQQPLPAGFAE